MSVLRHAGDRWCVCRSPALRLSCGYVDALPRRDRSVEETPYNTGRGFHRQSRGPSGGRAGPQNALLASAGRGYRTGPRHGCRGRTPNTLDPGAWSEGALWLVRLVPTRWAAPRGGNRARPAQSRKQDHPRPPLVRRIGPTNLPRPMKSGGSTNLPLCADFLALIVGEYGGTARHANACQRHHHIRELPLFRAAGQSASCRYSGGTRVGKPDKKPKSWKGGHAFSDDGGCDCPTWPRP